MLFNVWGRLDFLEITIKMFKWNWKYILITFNINWRFLWNFTIFTLNNHEFNINASQFNDDFYMWCEGRFAFWVGLVPQRAVPEVGEIIFSEQKNAPKIWNYFTRIVKYFRYFPTIHRFFKSIRSPKLWFFHSLNICWNSQNMHIFFQCRERILYSLRLLAQTRICFIIFVEKIIRFVPKHIVVYMLFLQIFIFSILSSIYNYIWMGRRFLAKIIVFKLVQMRIWK